MTSNRIVAGVLAIMVATSLMAQAQDDTPKKRKKRRSRVPNQIVVLGGGGGSALIRMPRVQEDLKLTDEQKTKINEAFKGINQAGDLRQLSGLTPEERRAKFRELMQKGREKQKEFQKVVKGTLSTEQLTRLEQIGIQSRGSAALFDKKVAGKLKLTEEQTKKMGKARNDATRKRVALSKKMSSGEIGQQEFRQEMAKLQPEMDKAIRAVLTDEQKESFEAMQGKKIDLPIRRAAGLRLVPGRFPLPGGARRKAKKRDDL